MVVKVICRKHREQEQVSISSGGGGGDYMMVIVTAVRPAAVKSFDLHAGEMGHRMAPPLPTSLTGLQY